MRDRELRYRHEISVWRIFFSSVALAEAAISIPFSAIRGDFRRPQVYGSASGSVLIGLGHYVGGGPNVAVGASDGPIQSHLLD